MFFNIFLFCLKGYSETLALTFEAQLSKKSSNNWGWAEKSRCLKKLCNKIICHKQDYLPLIIITEFTVNNSYEPLIWLFAVNNNNNL